MSTPQMPTPQVLQLLLSRGVPLPLAGLSAGSCAVVSEDHRLSVFDSAAPEWTLTAQARWPEIFTPNAHPWAALAPQSAGVVLLNMAACDISALPAGVRMSLDMQQQRHIPTPTRPAAGERFRVSLDSGELRITTPAGGVRALPIGAPYTVTPDAFRRHEEVTFSYLSPSLRVVAQAIAQFGPLATGELVHRVHPAPTDKNKAALNMSLTRLRRHPRVTLVRLDDGRLTITSSGAEQASLAPSG